MTGFTMRFEGRPCICVGGPDDGYRFVPFLTENGMRLPSGALYMPTETTKMVGDKEHTVYEYTPGLKESAP